MNQKPINTSFGPTIYHTYFYNGEEGDDAGFVFMISHYNNVLARDADVQSQALLSGVVEASVMEISGELQYQEFEEFRGVDCVTWRVKYNNDKNIMKARSIAHGKEVYILQVFTTSELALDHKVNRFLDSFDFL